MVQMKFHVNRSQILPKRRDMFEKLKEEGLRKKEFPATNVGESDVDDMW